MNHDSDLLYEAVEDRKWSTRGWWYNGMHSGGHSEYGYGGPGWMSERFCFCQGLLTEKYPDGSWASTWFALMSWAAASIIEGLAGSLFRGGFYVRNRN